MTTPTGSKEEMEGRSQSQPSAEAGAHIPPSPDAQSFDGKWRPDNGDGPVNFYERDFYPLSNFSSFEVEWTSNYRFKTAEHCYHWLRFATGAADGRLGGAPVCARALAAAETVRQARSAHDAFKIAQENKHLQRADWNGVKVEKMRLVIRAKALQHEYVRRKLLATGDRELVEGSWRDDFWGAGPDGRGQNMLGQLWMELRAELRAADKAGPLPLPPRDEPAACENSREEPTLPYREELERALREIATYWDHLIEDARPDDALVEIAKRALAQGADHG